MPKSTIIASKSDPQGRAFSFRPQLRRRLFLGNKRGGPNIPEVIARINHRMMILIERSPLLRYRNTSPPFKAELAMRDPNASPTARR
jgi:hypothetical protein